MADTTKTKTCSRCKGIGYVNSPVVHRGVPGLCYACDGTRKQVWVPLQVRLAAHVTSVSAWRREIEVAAERTVAKFEAMRPERQLRWAERHENDMQDLRQAWRRAGQNAPTKGKWCSPSEAASIEVLDESD